MSPSSLRIREITCYRTFTSFWSVSKQRICFNCDDYPKCWKFEHTSSLKDDIRKKSRSDAVLFFTLLHWKLTIDILFMEYQKHKFQILLGLLGRLFNQTKDTDIDIIKRIWGLLNNISIIFFTVNNCIIT